MRIFISYSRVEARLVESEIVDVLQAAGYDVWYDHELIPGQPWKEQILESIKRSDIFLYAMTPDSIQSEYCLWEFRRAVELDKRIIPVLLQHLDFSQVPSPLNSIQYVDFTRGATGMSVARLLHGLNRIQTNLPPSTVRNFPADPDEISSNAPVTIIEPQTEETPDQYSLHLIPAIIAGISTIAAAIISIVLTENLSFKIDSESFNEILTVTSIISVIVIAGLFAFTVYNILQKRQNKREEAVRIQLREKHSHLLDSIRNDVDRMIGKPADG